MSETEKLLSSDDDVLTDNDVTRKSKFFGLKKGKNSKKKICSKITQKSLDYIPGTLMKGK